MSEAEVAARFEALQRKLVPLWTSIQPINQDPQTIVVVPSMTLDATIHGVRQQAYEERFLFLLLLLRQPRARLIYVTSQAIHPEVVDYYLDLLPGVFAGHARKRLFLVSPLDGSARPLTQKLLDRPRLIEQIRSLIPDPGSRAPRAVQHDDARTRSGRGARHPDVRRRSEALRLGTKSGARRIFAEEGVPHPLGVEDLHSADDWSTAIVEMRARKPSIAQVVVKLNEGVSGEGNAHVDLAGLPATGVPSGDRGRSTALQAMQFESCEMTYDRYFAKLAERGGIVEELIAGSDFRSPSAQLRMTPLGEVEALSTHDQMLGGRAGRAISGAGSRRARVRPGDHARGDEGRPPADATKACSAGSRSTSSTVRNDARRVGGLRDRDQPAQRRHDASVPDAAVPDRRAVRRRDRRVHDAARRGQVLRRQRPRRVAALSRLHPRRPVRHRRAPRPALRPVAPEGRRVPHDERASASRACSG